MKSVVALALFAFNRPAHTARTLTALAACRGASDLDLVAFLDGARDDAEQLAVAAVRACFDQPLPFRSISIRAAGENKGLYRSITEGVSEVLRDYEQIIVLEDDLLVTADFLAFMSDSLIRFAREPAVACIHGYSLPIAGLPEFFFLRGGDCWGWATWRDRWQLFHGDPEMVIRELVQRDALDAYMQTQGAGSLQMLCDRALGRNESWAILWHASLWLADRLTLHPGRSFVTNIGNDGSGTHSGNTGRFMAGACEHYHGLPTLALKQDPVAANLVCAFHDQTPWPLGRLSAWWRRRLARRAARRLAGASS